MSHTEDLAEVDDEMCEIGRHDLMKWNCISYLCVLTLETSLLPAFRRVLLVLVAASLVQDATDVATLGFQVLLDLGLLIILPTVPLGLHQDVVRGVGGVVTGEVPVLGMRRNYHC